jgi:hypothetical protein
MPGSFEQLWTRRAEGGAFEVCCIPYFTYGVALGDLVEWTEQTHRLDVRRKSGHRNLRIAFHDRNDATAEHEQLHGTIVQTGCLVEFSADGYAAVDIETDEQRDAVLAVLDPLVTAGRLIWEWGDDRS